MEKKKILIIDDDRLMRTMICKTIQLYPYELYEAENGQDGLELIERNVPDIVITDIVMPHKDGLEIIMAIRKSWPDMGLIAISGNSVGWGGDYLGMSLKLGADAVFSKPMNFEKFERVLVELLELRPANRVGIDFYQDGTAQQNISLK